MTLSNQMTWGPICVVECQGGRQYMEDTHVIDDDMLLICDGHGGDFVAKWLKENVKDYFDKYVTTTSSSTSTSLYDSTFPDMLYTMIQNIIQDIPKLDSYMCGSTFILATKYNNAIYIVNIGDSRGIFINNNGIHGHTYDHKPDVEQQRIQNAGGFVTFNSNDVPRVNGNLALSRSIGDFYLSPAVAWIPDIYIITIENTEYNILVMASDGVWDVFNNEEISVMIQRKVFEKDITYTLLKELGQEILYTARMRGSSDNITLIITVVT
jgi:serine/threonine protein phosphatase PrpC